MAQAVKQQQKIKNNVHKLQFVNRDRGYRFEDRDPDMEYLCDIIHREEISVGDLIKKVLDASDNQVSISYTTISNWLSGKTRRPQNWTLRWVAYALGYERSWNKIR